MSIYNDSNAKINSPGNFISMYIYYMYNFIYNRQYMGHLYADQTDLKS